MNYTEKLALSGRARKSADKHRDLATNYPWMFAADFAATEIDRERRRVRRAKAKKARKR